MPRSVSSEHPFSDDYYSRNINCGCYFVVNRIKEKARRSSCDQWSCPVCRKKKILHFREDLERLVELCQMKKFMTLTLGGYEDYVDNTLGCVYREYRGTHSPVESFDYMAKKWDLLRHKIVRKYGEIRYVVLPRSHRNGFAHYHILIDKRIDIGWLSRTCADIGLGKPYIDERDPRFTSWYLTHLSVNSKEHEYFIPKGKKHYSMSRGLKLIHLDFFPYDVWDYTVNCDSFPSEWLDSEYLE